MKQPLLIPIIHDGEACYQLYEEYEGIPKGLVVDGASIPRILWSYKPPDGIHRRQALWHDWRYINKGFSDRPPEGRFTRKECDDLFRVGLVLDGLDSTDACVMWLGVRLGGWIPWSKPKRPPIILPVSLSSRNTEKSHKGHIYAP